MMKRILLLLCLIFCKACSASDAVCNEDAETETCSSNVLDDPALLYAQALVEDLKALSGGYFNDKLEVRRKKPQDLTSKFGLFATQDIEKDEMLLKLPPAALIRITANNEWEEDVCELKELFLTELQKGDESDYATYIKFLKAINAGSELPSAWSDEGQRLLEEMLWDEQIDPHNRLPPDAATTFLDMNCIDKDNDDDVFAMLVTMSRGWDTALTPVYDFISHDNAKINTENTSVQDQDGLSVKAKDAIKEGHELFYSFDRCIDCGDVDEESFGTPEIFRDLGIIEGYPQRFHIGGNGLTSLLTVEVDIEQIDEKEEFLTAEFLFENEPIYGSYLGGVRFMKEHLARLKEFKTKELISSKVFLPDMEYKKLMQYHETLTDMLSIAVAMAEEQYFEREIDFSKLELNTESEYVVPEETEVIEHLDKFRQIFYQAETLVYASDHYEEMQQFQSQYQQIDYYKDPETEDVCFHLDTIFQMCGSYWPYYHEVQVHKAAKYIKEDIKRVLFVGAGDNGLLNEIVKYPSLELVVGLELDQHVARLAFKQFGKRTHYHNEKVQWWYGDASKTLYMLPKEYFGSFDLVLVDLSDTIFALSVTDELDVVGALSLLLRPGGIFAMNELCFKRVSDVFKHSLYHQINGMPKLGDQGFVFASNDVDLLNQDLTHHKIDGNLVEDTLIKTKHQFDFVHDYRSNPSSVFETICKNVTKEEEDTKAQSASNSIFMALEAEDLVYKDLASASKVQTTIEEALKEQGLHLISSSDVSAVQFMFVSVLKEGYIAARLFPNDNYVALDILLWSSFEKFENVKAALVKSIGGKMESTSSFRIVTGGMFGLETWKEDMKSHGPQISNLCTEDKVPARASPSPETMFEIALEGSIGLVQNKDAFTVAVLCGTEKEPCESVKQLNKDKRVSKVIPLYACADTKSSIEELKKCAEEAAVSKLEKAKGKIQLLAVDHLAPNSMDEVITAMAKHEFLEENFYVVATIDSQKELWRREVVDRVRTQIRDMDPVFRAHVLLNSTDSSMELAVVASGDKYFIEHLKETVASIEKKFDDTVTLEIRNILGGKWKAEPNYIVEDDAGMKYFLPEDFDSTRAEEQYESQQPIGVQSITQYLNKRGAFTIPFSKEDVQSGFERAVLSEHIGKHVTQTVDDIGHGILHMAFWEAGMLIMSWDGRSQIDVNIFCEDLTILKGIEEDVEDSFRHVEIKLRDFHPRGHGQVVNFAEDLDGFKPHWA